MNVQPPSEIWATLAGVVDVQMTQRVFAFFADALRTGVKTAHLLMHSSGGFVTDGVGLYNYVANLPIEVITYNAGGVSSIAVIVFLAGKKRVANETATFMIHKSHATPPAGVTAAVLKEIADALDIDNDRTESILRKHVKMPEDKWKMHQHGNLTVTAQEAVKFELIHEIAPFAPPMSGPLFNL